ncbi:hypothetical protein SLE2022_261120 [Rubroshorea leprosula]
MANPNIAKSMVSSATSEQKEAPAGDSNLNMLQPTMNKQNRSSSDHHVAILWDIENCPIPSDVRPEDVAGNIRMALRVHPVIKGAVIMFSAYGDFNSFPRRLREGCQRTGVKLIDVPNGRKDAADKAILIDMFLFALDNPPPSSILLISGDVDFAPALHILGQRGYTVILVIPAGVGVSSALCNAGKFVWDWPSVAHGEGFVPPSKGLKHPRPTELAGYFMGCHINDNRDGQNEEESIVCRGIPQSYYNSRDFSIMSQSLSEYPSNPSITAPIFPANLRSHSLPSGLSEASGYPVSYDHNDTMWVQPGDVNGLKGQLVKLLESSGGCLPFTRVHAEYQKMFGRPLYCSEYGAFKLVNLFKKMGDAMAIDGKGQKKFVYLRSWKASPNEPPVALARKDKKGKGTVEENVDFAPGGGSSDDYSDEERMADEEQDDRRNLGRINLGMGPTAGCEVDDSYLEQFKYELQEILVSYSCQIFVGCFEAIYQQRYKKPLNYQKLGIEKLEELFEKVRDVAVMQVDPVSKKKFLAAVDG